MTNPSPHTIDNPVLHDGAAAAINNRLSNLDWLETTYGAVSKMTKEKDGRKYNYPGIYAGGSDGGEYIDLLPDTHLFENSGGYSYLEFNDSQDFKNWNNGGMLEMDFALVVWFDFRKVYDTATWKGKAVSNVVQLVLDELAKGTGQAVLEHSLKFRYSAERIYRGYTHNEIKKQFLMKPYGGFRIDTKLIYQPSC